MLDVHTTAHAPRRATTTPERSRSWRTLAACRDQDPAPFYRRPYTRALVCCGRCLVAECCLFEALVLEQGCERPDQRHGAWGATTPTQRHLLATELQSRGISPAELANSERTHWSRVLSGYPGTSLPRSARAVA